MTEQAQRIRWDKDFKTYRFEDSQGNVVLNFTSQQAAAEHHYTQWAKAEKAEGRLRTEAKEAERRTICLNRIRAAITELDFGGRQGPAEAAKLAKGD